MKKQRLLLFTVIAILMLGISACSDKDETVPADTQQEAPVLETKTVELPETLVNSNDPAAQDVVAYTYMVNGFTGFAGLMTPPGGQGGGYKSTNDGDPLVYTWDFVEGEDAYSITLTIIQTETHYEWTMVINGTLGGMVLVDFTYMEASQTLDGATGEYNMYDPEYGLLMSVVWSTDSSGVYTTTFEAPEDIKIEMTSNPDGSGTITVYEWYENGWVIEFEAIWDSSGHGEYWEYYEGELIDHGIF